ncbi:MAG: cell division protein FtsZ, partial [Bacteroidota bacterium]
MSSSKEPINIAFDLPKNQSNVIKVIGVGGGGSNAINYMFKQGIKGVDFVICNTDAQALQNSAVPNKIQLGVSLTEGLGAGANPEIGEQAALESLDDIKAMLETNTKMVFITAGMGGGTGTGAAPVIAKMAKEMDILTVGIVTIPFQFEGKTRNEQAQKGVENMRKHIDALIVINNNKLREVYGNLGFKAGFSKADEVLATASRGIAEVITHHYTQNIDLKDAKTVLSNSGSAIMGSASAAGAQRAQEAITKALDSPLLNDNKIKGAKNVLLLIVSGKEEITIDEIGEINDHIQNEAGYNANIIMGVGEDETLGKAISVTVIATGFNAEQQHNIVNTEVKKIIHTLEDEQRAEQNLSPDITFSSMPLPIKEEKKEGKAPIIRHTLVEDEATVALVPTSEVIKNINVVYEEVPAAADDFVIIDTTAALKEIHVVDAEEVHPADEDQTALVFDLPINPRKAQTAEEEDQITFKLSDAIKDYEVKDPIEIDPAEAFADEDDQHYTLDDYIKMENNLINASPEGETDEALVFQKKVIPEVPKEESAETPHTVNPLNSSIEESLKQRAEERRKRLKEFNHKFNLSKIDEIEKQPAYKRMGVELDEEKNDEKISRTTLSTDSN